MMIADASNGAIRKNLFIIGPNNSGSHILRSALAKSHKTWNLDREGQHVEGFCGPTTYGTGSRLIWASNLEWQYRFLRSEAYNWPKTRQAWYGRATAHSRQASVFVTSSPPFLLNVSILREEFENPHFLFMVRNPYAVIEGICRRASQQMADGDEDIRVLAARHVAKCLEFQRKNIRDHSDCGLFFTYEDLCKSPDKIAEKITMLVPELDDLDFGQSLSIKGLYNEPLRDMNADQIAQFDNEDIAVINSELLWHEPLVKHFGYDLIS